MDAPISSPIAAHHSSSSSTSTQSSIAAVQFASSQNFVPPQPRQVKQHSTDTFIRDLNLVAEAAKRAEMACLMRDMESVGIS